jgi:hypothetical protein
MAPGLGIGPGRRLASRSQSTFAAVGGVAAAMAPDGDGATGETDTGAGAADDPHPPMMIATANSGNIIRVFTGTP